MREQIGGSGAWVGVIAVAGGLALAAACGGSGNNVGNDMAQSGADLSHGAGADLSQSGADLAMSSSPDLIGVDVSCNPSSVLAGSADPTGTWTYVAGCAADDAFKDIKDNCTATFSGTAVTGPASAPAPQGTLTLASGGTFTRVVHATVSTNATISGTCAAAGCANIQSAINGFASGVTATCTGTGTCSCALAIQVNTNDTGTWTHSGNTITANASGSQTYTYGLDGNVFRYRGDASNANGDRGVTYVLIK